MRPHLDIFDKAHSHIEHCRRHYSKQPRLASFHFALWSVRHCFNVEKTTSNLHEENLRVALVLDGGMGDILLHIRYVKDLCSQCGPFSLDIYSPLSPDITLKLFNSIEHVNDVKTGKVEEVYDLVLYSLFLPMTVFCDRKRLEKLGSPNLKKYIDSLENFKAKNPLWFSQQEYFMADILNYARILQRNRATLPYMIGNIKPEATDAGDLKPSVTFFPWGEKPFIVISRGAGAESESTKLWPIEHYNTLLNLIRKHFPDIILVQTGQTKEKALTVDYDLRGKTSFDELAALMRKATLLISSESGTVHLRHILQGGPSVVFFGPTDPAFYNYPENCNLRAEVCTPCEWIQRDWQKHCVRGLNACMALAELLPQQVFKEMMSHGNILESLCKKS